MMFLVNATLFLRVDQGVISVIVVGKTILTYTYVTVALYRSHYIKIASTYSLFMHNV